MKLIKLVGDVIKPVLAEPYINKETDTKYFNILIGSVKDKCYSRYIKLDTSVFGNPIINKSFELIDDDYIIKPINNKSEFNYVLSKDNSDIHKNDVLLIWELPNINQDKTEVDIKGTYDILLETKYVKRRKDKKYSSPILILELMSDCVLSVTIDGVRSSIKFIHKTSEFKRI